MCLRLLFRFDGFFTRLSLRCPRGSSTRERRSPSPAAEKAQRRKQHNPTAVRELQRRSRRHTHREKERAFVMHSTTYVSEKLSALRRIRVSERNPRKAPPRAAAVACRKRLKKPSRSFQPNKQIHSQAIRPVSAAPKGLKATASRTPSRVYTAAFSCHSPGRVQGADGGRDCKAGKQPEKQSLSPQSNSASA